MRIAYLTTSDLTSTSANSVQVMKMAQAFLRLGHDLVMTAACQRGRRVLSEELSERYGVREVAEALDCSPVRGRFGIHVFNLRASWIAKKSASEVVVTRSVGAACFSALLGLSVVFECHAPPAGFERHLFWTLLKSGKLRRIVFISDALKKIFFQRYRGLKDTDFVVAHDGVDLHQFKNHPTPELAKSKFGYPKDRLVAGYCGHLYQGRGIDLILQCAKRLPEWTFLVVGGAEADVSDVRNRLLDLDIRNVELTGFQPNSIVPELMSVCDVLLMPYQEKVFVRGGRLDTSSWMSPLKMFEYLAMGRAIVSSDLPVLREVLDDDIAILVKPSNIGEWVERLKSLESKVLRDRLAVAARKVARNYSWNNRARDILCGIRYY